MKPSIISKDPWLEPYSAQFKWQWQYISSASGRILGDKSVEDFALGHLYFGLHKTSDGWVFREWAPHATALYLVCERSKWLDDDAFKLARLPQGVWELRVSDSFLKHGDHYKLHVHWPGGSGCRLPSYVTYAVQDPGSHVFDAVVWAPEQEYEWRHSLPVVRESPLIYEAHVGMSSEDGVVASYDYFRRSVLPRIKALGYNTVQLMAIQEHPYYGSFGYHVSNFFAASSRFGTPDELKMLIDEAHGMGLRVIMDVVHSHAVKNEEEGLSRFDGTLTQYFHDGDRGNHEAWDSRVFDYGKPEVVHFLLSNLRFWLDEYRFDGFRFDGVTSMLYKDHGLERAFGSYDEYVSDNVDLDALAYLHMANELVHRVKPSSLTIAEDMSAFPGLAAPQSATGGMGFDYRLSMGVPDLWIKTLKEQRDEDWDLGHLFHELTAHRPEERVISYSESHDQALVGDKTLIFRLMDKEMYEHMRIDDQSLVVERAIALHKIIRLLTASTHGGGYLNFMGNEFGHPEWIDFPREGNGWSYQYARRQWSLADDVTLKYQWLQSFDKAMVALLSRTVGEYHYVTINETHRTLSFARGEYLFVYNLSPTESYADCTIPTFDGQYSIVLCSDDEKYGGHGRVDTELSYVASDEQIQLYLPSRTALVLCRQS